MLNIYLCDDETVQLLCLKKQIEKYLVDTKKEAVLVFCRNQIRRKP